MHTTVYLFYSLDHDENSRNQIAFDQGLKDKDRIMKNRSLIDSEVAFHEDYATAIRCIKVIYTKHRQSSAYTVL